MKNNIGLRYSEVSLYSAKALAEIGQIHKPTYLSVLVKKSTVMMENNNFLSNQSHKVLAQNCCTYFTKIQCTQLHFMLPKLLLYSYVRTNRRCRSISGYLVPYATSLIKRACGYHKEEKQCTVLTLDHANLIQKEDFVAHNKNTLIACVQSDFRCCS